MATLIDIIIFHCFMTFIVLQGQYPLPGFSITQWNSLHSLQELSATEWEESDDCNIYIETSLSILRFFIFESILILINI